MSNIKKSEDRKREEFYKEMAISDAKILIMVLGWVIVFLLICSNYKKEHSHGLTRSESFTIGSLVKIKGVDGIVMITGYCQKEESSRSVYDYIGVPFPEGYLGSEYNYVFNNEDIEGTPNIDTNDLDKMAVEKKEEIIEWSSDIASVDEP